jgi:hypothetical protein
MDPNATLLALGRTAGMSAYHGRKARGELCTALRDWLWHGGFEPTWNQGGDVGIGTSYFRNWCRRNGPERYARVGL